MSVAEILPGPDDARLPASAAAGAHAMSVDVEDWFQVQAFAPFIDRATWEGRPRRVETNTHAVLDLFARHGTRATFFTLGWVAERHPSLIRRIVAEGHELASHGHAHHPLHELDAFRFRADVRRAKRLLEDIGGVAVTGYRAPSFSIGAHTPWAHEVLAEEGHRYSSSVYPVRHDHYGSPDAPRTPYRVAGGALLEIPPTTCRVLGRNLPCSGGGYFRLLPLTVSDLAFRKAARQLGRCVFYFHPWEIDPGQPRPAGASAKARFRHSVNLSAMRGRLVKMLGRFAWDRMDRIFPTD
ncbi:XrtA system polysaccharide deacetylase [Rhodocista pekingensis]|uniref:Chitooligosaccharide deacetylase n=1 Tax=Rhodocista pekingensis TaxID=201185 RepID=A0ABW2L115_9PROT